ncbi:hypothetical protein DVH24_036864 [Malus domestica]|uniref:Uncharacterized protein n=1 Tax=Malus domestica TaxID=3750 RepID=A0A498IMR7_MALDO|nr:hypothetical protein DVH24_036864 [Malus domestica]
MTKLKLMMMMTKMMMRRSTHKWGLYRVFACGSNHPLYDEIISLCLDLVELDAAVAIVADMETTGISPRRDIGPGDFC